MSEKVTYQEESQARRALVKWGKELYDQGLVKGSGGNLSIRLSDGTVLLTPTGFFLGHMTEECISRCDMEGNLLGGNAPTKEVPLHLAVYRTRPNIRAVCHTHSVYAVASASTMAPGTMMPLC
ncbi:MAG: class II aldolase/adducin family protein, partial [Lawsonibacter sp.]